MLGLYFQIPTSSVLKTLQPRKLESQQATAQELSVFYVILSCTSLPNKTVTVIVRKLTYSKLSEII